MIFSKNSKINEEREQIKKKLFDQINSAVQNTGFTLSKLEVHPDIFGNAVIEFSKDHLTIRFVQDRGDIYMDKKKDNNNSWTDQKLMFNHSENVGDSYDTLIKAIKQIIK